MVGSIECLSVAANPYRSPTSTRRREIMLMLPTFLPDGQRFVFQAFSQDASKHAVFVGSLEGGSRSHLLDGMTNTAYADGYLLYHRDGTLMAQPFDDRTGHFAGSAVPTVENLFTGERGFAAFSVARNGTLAYRAAGHGAATLAWFDMQGKRVPTPGGAGPYEHPSLSPDGRKLAVCRTENGQRDIWIVDLDRGIPSRLTSSPAIDDYPVWSSDGTRVIFASDRNGPDDLYWRAADGSGGDELLFASPEIKRPTSVSTDGTLLFTVRTGPGQNSLDVWGLPLNADNKPVPVLAAREANEYNAVFSPDGHWVAYQRGEGNGRTQIYLQPFQRPAPRFGCRRTAEDFRGGVATASGFSIALERRSMPWTSNLLTVQGCRKR
jgi:dipeptidyl aminopeptidase/acylaminoacyl peptidase